MKDGRRLCVHSCVHLPPQALLLLGTVCVVWMGVKPGCRLNNSLVRFGTLGRRRERTGVRVIIRGGQRGEGSGSSVGGVREERGQGVQRGAGTGSYQSAVLAASL